MRNSCKWWKNEATWWTPSKLMSQEVGLLLTADTGRKVCLIRKDNTFPRKSPQEDIKNESGARSEADAPVSYVGYPGSEKGIRVSRNLPNPFVVVVS
ncbi:hypothetical protein LAZ67_11001528 [Cordylochernes scorpioides]|uniref:Uncharacterized protein n=1 Tax=Cordylochernes scorpioides TaxID=51811 RepID=A0ABY6L189_9ARAC|nr:hypothetical protein LAZ67_11001528 [Cordylochernes scorpioides]